MILVHKIQYRELEPYKTDYLESLRQNMSNSLITKILIFSDLDIPGLPKNNKITFSLKKGYGEVDVLKYVKNVHKNETIIWSNPYAIFNHTLMKVNSIGKGKIIQLSSHSNGLLNKGSIDTLIFDNITIDESKQTVNESLIGERIDASLSIIVNNKRPSYSSKPIQTQTKHFDIPRRNIQKETTIEKQVIDLQSRRHVAKKEDIKVDPGIKVGKIDAVIVSVDYNDFLILTLKNNIKYLENITVVTSTSDTLCKEICDKFGVKCVITDKMYEDGAKFNKGKAINEGIKSIQNPDWILLLDADIIIPNSWNGIINSNIFKKDAIHICSRNIIENYDDYQRWINGEQVGRIESSKGFGYFQLFNINSNVLFGGNPIFPETSDDAAWSDLSFRNKFNNRVDIPISVVHLGKAYSNWKGRETDRFISDGYIENALMGKFNINEYFDKIYCLNLEKRKDRWVKVSDQFNRFSINVERFNAIDGQLISDDEFNSVNPDGISGEDASSSGIIENKNAMACLLSHINIIKDAKKNGYKKILIFEDDVLLSSDFTSRISKISEFNWKLIYLGASQFNWSNIKIKNGYYLSKNTLGTFAYAIDSSIYDMIIEVLDTKRKSVDNLLTEIQREIYGYCYTLYPNIVISDVNNSDIRGDKNMSQYSKMMRWDSSKFTYIKESSSIIRKKEALNNLIDLDRLFNNMGVEYWLTCGTLLGFYRNDDFIGHDKDTDICINADDFNGYVLKRILSIGFNIVKCFGRLDDGFEISLTRNDVKTDIFLFYKRDKWYNSVYYDFKKEDCLKYDYIYDPFEISENTFLGYSFKTPKDIESFLIHHYGHDFRTPNTEWLWWKSPKNVEETNIRVRYDESNSDITSLLSFDKSIYIDNITILIKSFLRKDCVDRLIGTIRRYYKTIKIIVIDDSGDVNYNFNYDDNIKTYSIDFDSGLSKGRNFGVSIIDTEFFILLDDDFEFTEKTDIIKWMDIMIDSNLDILGGDVIMNSQKIEYFGNFELKNKCLYYKNERYEIYDKYKTCDFVLNFFIAKTSKIREFKWDDELKLAEHTAYFFEHKGKIKVGHTDEISIDHQKINEGEYSIYRNRGKDFFNVWMIRKDIEMTVNLKGEVTRRK